MAENEKGRPVQITHPGYSIDRTNTLRLEKDNAQRIIARYLREKMNPGEANDLANRIVDGLISNTSSPARPALRGWRMIDRHPPAEMTDRIASAIKRVRLAGCSDYATAAEAWEIVCNHGTAIPEEVVT
jgi:hypothetical protein